MSENPAPYATGNPPTFEPRPLRFRVWDGERMWYPSDDNGDYYLSPEGDLSQDVGGYSVELINTEGVAMLSTGLTDAEGREIFEGDVVTCPDWQEPLPVTWDDVLGAWVVGDQWTLGALCADNEPEVIGHVYEP